MTQLAIQEQIAAIKKVTRKVSKSKETAIRFLQDAGIVADKKTTKVDKKKSK